MELCELLCILDPYNCLFANKESDKNEFLQQQKKIHTVTATLKIEK